MPVLLAPTSMVTDGALFAKAYSEPCRRAWGAFSSLWSSDHARAFLFQWNPRRPTYFRFSRVSARAVACGQLQGPFSRPPASALYTALGDILGAPLPIRGHPKPRGASAAGQPQGCQPGYGMTGGVAIIRNEPHER